MDASNRVIDSVESVPVSWELSTNILGTLEKREGVLVGTDSKDGVLQPGGAHQVSDFNKKKNLNSSPNKKIIYLTRRT